MDNILQEEITIGRKIERIRRIRGIKQDDLARSLGVTRQAISKLEQSEQVDDEKLGQIAAALGVTAETIKNFKEDTAINYIQYNYEGSNKDASNVSILTQNCTFNPLEKYIEAIEENKRLYEALLKSEREKLALIEKMMDKKS
ncbi:helix-turn-helix domain-containing protein [Pedobacter panaciterrae]|uniref:helix-turn-helix domain-containing protein n=1 Tax=Pedobacter panaciterrae TaxID=363849 RepID=UPI0025939C4A|nr:helix-turn-helix transcriptional regulator [uncultured Pedobacter sp.]